MISFVLALLATAFAGGRKGEEAAEVLEGILFQYPGDYRTYTFTVLWPFEPMQEDVWLYGPGFSEVSQVFNRTLHERELAQQLLKLPTLPPAHFDFRVHEAVWHDPDDIPEFGFVWLAVQIDVTGPVFSIRHQQAVDSGENPSMALVRYMNEYLEELLRHGQVSHGNWWIMGVNGPGLPVYTPVLTESERTELESKQLLGLPTGELGLRQIALRLFRSWPREPPSPW